MPETHRATHGESLSCAVEVREGDTPELFGTILSEGRSASGGRKELFIPGSCCWPPGGIHVRLNHLGESQTLAVPVRDDLGRIEIRTKATPAIIEAVRSGSKFMSVEFVALKERRVSGIREVMQAFLSGATLTDRPEYDTTRAEVRSQRRRVWR